MLIIKTGERVTSRNSREKPPYRAVIEDMPDHSEGSEPFKMFEFNSLTNKSKTEVKAPHFPRKRAGPTVIEDPPGIPIRMEVFRSTYSRSATYKRRHKTPEMSPKKCDSLTVSQKDRTPMTREGDPILGWSPSFYNCGK